MDLVQLEKWCANELSGMSKSRILCILNGKPMLESSDTSESDDSGMFSVMYVRFYYMLYINYFHDNRTLLGNYLRYRGMVY